MKCQKCHNPATLHITEVLGEGQFEELHLCDKCANKYLYEPQHKGAKSAGSEGVAESEETAALNQRECPQCGIKFVEPSRVAKLDKLDAALGTFALVKRRCFFAFRDAFGAGALGPFVLRLIKVLIGALIAQVEFFKLAFAKHLGDVQRGRVVALLALHRRLPRLLAAFFLRSCAILT